MIEIIFLDVDGCMSDGGLYKTNSSDEFKRFDVKDGFAIQQWNRMGKISAIITGNSSQIVADRAKELEIKYCFQGVSDKLAKAKEILELEGLSLSVKAVSPLIFPVISSSPSITLTFHLPIITDGSVGTTSTTTCDAVNFSYEIVCGNVENGVVVKTRVPESSNISVNNAFVSNPLDDIFHPLVYYIFIFQKLVYYHNHHIRYMRPYLLVYIYVFHTILLVLKIYILQNIYNYNNILL